MVTAVNQSLKSSPSQKLQPWTRGNPSSLLIAPSIFTVETTKPLIMFFKMDLKARATVTTYICTRSTVITPPSNFISTSPLKHVGIDFATGYETRKGFLYVLKKIPGRDVNKELGKLAPFDAEAEIAIQSKINAEDILGATPMKRDGSYVGYSIPNPNRKVK